MSYAYRCGPTAAINNRTSWGPVSTPVEHNFDRPLSGNFDRIFNAFEKTNAYEYVRCGERQPARGDVVVNRRLKTGSSFERADCSLAAQPPCENDEDFYREKILYSQTRQLYPLQEDLADWINKTIGITYLNGENFFDVLDNGVELCQLAAVIHDKAKEALDQGLIVGPVPQIRGRCWQRAARRSFFSRDNTENFITFCRDLGVHENLLFESDDLVLHNQPRQVILCLLELARLATRFNLEPPGLVQLEREIALEETDSGLDCSSNTASWQFRECSRDTSGDKTSLVEALPSSAENDSAVSVVDPVDNDTESTKSGGTVDSADSDVPLKPTNELDKRVQLVTRLMERGCQCGAGRCSKLLKVKKVGEGRYNIAGRNVFIRLLKGRHMMVRVGGGWDTLEHFLSRHEPCQVRLVTAPGRAALLPAPPAPPAPAAPSVDTPAPENALDSNGLTDKPTQINGKISPVEKSGRSSKTSSGKSSPTGEPRRTSTPTKPVKNRSALTLPLNKDVTDTPRTRKQSAPACYSTPNTPTTRVAKTPPHENRKVFTPTLSNAPKKSRSMSLAPQKDEKKIAPKLNKNNRSISLASTPTNTLSKSQSLASTPVNGNGKSFCGTDRLNAGKKTRSMSLASPLGYKPMNKSLSLGTNMTQAAIEESIRISLAATIADNTNNKPFLHIKAKYRSPPPREVPNR